MNLIAIIADLKAITLSQVIRHGIVFFGALTTFWAVSGTVLKPYAKETFKTIMADAGVDPEAFKKLLKDTGELATDNDRIRNDINAVKKQNEEQLKQQDQIQNTQEQLDNQVDRMERTLDKLLDAVIDKKKAEISP